MVLALVASTFVVMTPVRAAPAGAAAHPAATDSINPTNQYGTYEDNFYVGYSQGVIYFTAYDPSGDTSATVHINDLNATRDGLTNPVYTATPSFTGGYYNFSYEFGGQGYLIPLSLNYGGLWNITISGANGGNSSTPFFVHTYRTSIETGNRAYLPGHTATGLFGVFRTANNAPYDLAVTTITGVYWSTAATYKSLFTAKVYSDVAVQNFTFSVPLDASTTGALYLYAWSNVTGTNLNVSEEDSVYTPVGNLSSPSILLSDCSFGCGSVSSFPAGGVAFLTVATSIVWGGSSVPAAGMKVQLQFIVDGAAVVPPDVPLNLSTNDSGGAQVLFLASSTVFSTAAANEIVVTVSDPANLNLGTFTSHVYFAVQSAGSTPAALGLTLDSQQYFGGDTVTATWQLGTANATAATGWMTTVWYASTSSGTELIAWGTINSTASSGTFSFPIPLNLGGTLYVDVEASNASSYLIAESDAYVTQPTILLNPSELYYLPGDHVTVSVTTEGSVFSGTTLYQSVVAASGQSYASGSLSGNSISFTIPTTAAPSTVTVSVAAQSATLGVVGSDTVSLSLASGYLVNAGVTTKSNYPDGSFQPGQSIDLTYTVQSLGTTPLPKSFQIYIYPGYALYFGGSEGTVYQESSSPTGTVSYTIPSGTPAGIQTFTVFVISGVCGYYCEAATTFAVNVQPNPSPLGYEVGAGSGLTVGWIILFVLVVLVAIVLYMAIRRGRGGGPKPEAMKPYSPSSSAGGSGGSSSSSGSTNAWQETPGGSGGSSSSPPPMPQSPQ